MSQLSIFAIGMPGIQEMIVIFLVMLLIFGAKLPEVARSLGKIFAEVQHGFTQFKTELMNPKNSSYPSSTDGTPRSKSLPPPDNLLSYLDRPVQGTDSENESGDFADDDVDSEEKTPVENTSNDTVAEAESNKNESAHPGGNE